MDSLKNHGFDEISRQPTFAVVLVLVRDIQAGNLLGRIGLNYGTGLRERRLLRNSIQSAGSHNVYMSESFVYMKVSKIILPEVLTRNVFSVPLKSLSPTRIIPSKQLQKHLSKPLSARAH